MEGVFEKAIMKARFSHVFNDDITGITFIYFKAGTVQNLSKVIDFQDKFCVHMSSQDTDKLKSALVKELNKDTVFSPQEMGVLRNIAHPNHHLMCKKASSMTNDEWEKFLAKLRD